MAPVAAMMTDERDALRHGWEYLFDIHCFLAVQVLYHAIDFCAVVMWAL